MTGARDSGLVAALPLAATAALLSARLLPVHFEYRENALGIVSLASLARLRTRRAASAWEGEGRACLGAAASQRGREAVQVR